MSEKSPNKKPPVKTKKPPAKRAAVAKPMAKERQAAVVPDRTNPAYRPPYTAEAASSSAVTKVAAILGYTLWVTASFILASLVVGLVAGVYQGSLLSIMSENVANIAVGTIVYVVMLGILLGIPAIIWRKGLSRKVLGLTWLPTWRDVGLALAGTVLYMIATVIVMLIVTALLPWINMDEAQEIGIKAPQGYEVWLTFFLLVIVAPVAEELVFRGYLYGKLRERRVPIWLSVVVVSALFGAAHMQWNVAIVVGVMSIFMCLGREISGSIWPGLIIHMMKNGLAFYLLFVNTALVAIL